MQAIDPAAGIADCHRSPSAAYGMAKPKKPSSTVSG